jgi:metallo-beta-lactamase class B
VTSAQALPIRNCARSVLVAALGSTLPLAAAPLRPDAPIECRDCVAWNEPLEPLRIHGSTYYVGTAGLSAILVSTEDGLVLLDGALPQSAARIDESIRKLGFRTEDIRLIMSSHAHYDHAGGIAALQRASGAVVAVSAPSAIAFRGDPATDDPQFTLVSARFPKVSNLRIVRDRETQRVGGAAFTPYFTPGHSPGSTTWTWQSCEGGVCVDVVYADSLNPVSADEFRFTGDATRPSIADEFRASIRTVASLQCDILLSPHPGFFGLTDKLARRGADAPNPFIDADACRKYAEAARERLELRIAQEARAAPN